MKSIRVGTVLRALGLFAIGAASIPVTSGDAVAGIKYTSPVTVNVAGRSATGGIGYARNTANGTESIGCSVTQYIGSQSMYCSARNTANQAVSCSSTDPAFIAAARSLGMDSHLSFRANAAGTCEYLYIEFYSWNQPKAL